MTTDKVSEIAALDDSCRKAMGVAGRVYQTTGISALPLKDQSAITPHSDPYSERDFGAFEHNGERIFRKIDYYDATVIKGSEDPSDPKGLTIMLASLTPACALRAPGGLSQHGSSSR
jgi:Protein of unknown function (DUF3768)